MKRLYAQTPALAKPSREDFLAALEDACRAKVSDLVQAVLIAEVDEFLGRLRSERAGARSGYRDGYEAERTVTYGSTPVAIRRPRVRGSETRFESQILPPYRRRFEDVDATLHELWIQGLSTRDFEPCLRALLGEQTPLSPSATNNRFPPSSLENCGASSFRAE